MQGYTSTETYVQQPTGKYFFLLPCTWPASATLHKVVPGAKLLTTYSTNLLLSNQCALACPANHPIILFQYESSFNTLGAIINLT